jgi:hypothetical protein
MSVNATRQEMKSEVARCESCEKRKEQVNGIHAWHKLVHVGKPSDNRSNNDKSMQDHCAQHADSQQYMIVADMKMHLSVLNKIDRISKAMTSYLIVTTKTRTARNFSSVIQVVSTFVMTLPIKACGGRFQMLTSYDHSTLSPMS